MTHPPSPSNPATWLELSSVAFAFALAGVVATLPFVLRADDTMATFTILAWPAAVAAALTGTAMWAALVWARREKPLPALAGALAGVFAHPIVWFLVALQEAFAMGDSPQVVLGSMLTSAFFSVFSMVAYGPLTAGLGALVAWGIARSVRR